MIALKNQQRMQYKLLQIAEATGDLIGNRIADKIRSFSNKSPTELHFKELQNDKKEEPKKDTYLQTKDNKLLMT